MCNDERKNKQETNGMPKKSKGDEDMTAGTEFKPVKSAKVETEAFKDLVDYVSHPPEASDFVKDLIKNYRKQRRDK